MQTLENVLGALIMQIGRGLGLIPADQLSIPESRVKLGSRPPGS